MVCAAGLLVFIAYQLGRVDEQAYHKRCHCIVDKKWSS